MTTIQTLSLPTRNGTFRVVLCGPEDAPVLMLSNSLGTTLEMWEGQRAAFFPTHRVICYDTRGHGGSPTTPGPYRINELGDDVLAIMDALDVERAAFCGISLGGHTALWLGANAGERFTGIAVCNSAARIGTVESWQERASTVRSGGLQAMQALAGSAPQRWFTPEFAELQPQVVAAAQEWIERTDPEGYAACCEALGESDLRADQRRISIPTLILAGEADPVITVADARAMHEAIAGSEFVSVPASHLSNLEAPAAFNQALGAFLSRLS